MNEARRNNGDTDIFLNIQLTRYGHRDKAFTKGSIISREENAGRSRCIVVKD
jgi:hypothetical protein